MYEFRGIDLNIKYIKPSTWEWLRRRAGEEDAPFEGYFYDNFMGADCGILIWTFSTDPDDPEMPSELAQIVRTAYERDWRVIVIDGDGADCELSRDYS